MSVVITGTQIILWCFDERNNSKFKVVIGNGNDIDDLKEAIKEKCKPLFDGFASHALILWRVDATQVTSEILKDKLEDTAKTIGETFHNEGGNIRVIVRAPDTDQPVAGDITSLKREFENVIKEELVNVKGELVNVKGEVGGLRHEIERIRLHSEVMWFSAPSTITETAKGIYVRDHGQDISFPFPLTTTTQRRILEKFRNPPNANNTTVPEKELQEFFMRECTALGLLDSTKLIVHDTHSTPLLDTRKPDFVLIPKGWPLDSLNVAVVGEIRTQSSNGFSNADVGHAVSFGEKVLQVQPRRAYVYVLLTDCIDICIFKVTRLDNANNGSVRFSYGRISLQTLTFNTRDNPPTGWRYLVTIMECAHNNLGWVNPSLNFGSDTVNLVRSINTGRTSVVYEGKVNDSNRVVVKLAKEDKYLPCFVTEKNVLNELSAMNSPHLQKLLLEGEGVLVTTPLGSKVNHLQKKDIRDIIKTLETVHSTYNRVHMDLRRYNFLRDDDGQIVIIDWGYSVAKDETGNFAGALEVMPDDILTSLTNGEQIKYSPRIDLICFVRASYLMFHKPTNAEIGRMSFNGTPDIKSQAQKILNFWSNHGKSYLWENFYQQASELKYDDLIKGLEALF